MSIPISVGSGAASVAAEVVAGLQYQQIEVLGKGGASTMGVNPDGSINASIIGTPNINVSGSVFATFSGAGSVITVWKDSSVIAVATGSVVTLPTGNQSVSGTVGASIIGWVPVQTSNSSVIVYVQNSIAAVIIGGSVAATVTPAANQSVSGAINVSGSVLLGSSNASVITVWQNSSVIAINAGSVVTIVPGSVITVWKDSSILAVPVGSTLTIWQSPSIVGTYAEDAAHASGDKGIFGLNVRNDTLSSITSTDLDYSPMAVGPTGEVIIANAPITKWVQGSANMSGTGATGTSVIVISSGGSSVFTYITAVQVANFGSASVIVTFASGGSTLGYTIAPAGGGSNILTPNAMKTPGNFGFAASISGVASVFVSAQGFISKT